MMPASSDAFGHSPPRILFLKTYCECTSCDDFCNIHLSNILYCSKDFDIYPFIQNLHLSCNVIKHQNWKIPQRSFLQHLHLLKPKEILDCLKSYEQLVILDPTPADFSICSFSHNSKEPPRQEFVHQILYQFLSFICLYNYY